MSTYEWGLVSEYRTPAWAARLTTTPNALLCEELLHTGAVGDVELDEGEPVTPFELRQPVALELGVVVVVEVVEADHRPAVVEQAFGEMEADEAGCAGHEGWLGFEVFGRHGLLFTLVGEFIVVQALVAV